MTNNEINEYIGRKLFQEETFYEKKDYTKNWQQVVEKMTSFHFAPIIIIPPSEKGYTVSIPCMGCVDCDIESDFYFEDEDDASCVNDILKNGKTIGEAVCRATVKYLKRKRL